jgi:SHS2 domain-containing protein
VVLAVTSSDDAGFEVLEHTADIGIRAWGRTTPEVFERAAWALVDVMGVRVEGSGSRRTVEVRAEDAAALLVGFLNELIWLHESGSEGFAAIGVVSVTAQDLVAEVELAPIPSDAAGLGVKAATYHQVRVDPREGGGVEAVVYLDV